MKIKAVLQLIWNMIGMTGKTKLRLAKLTPRSTSTNINPYNRLGASLSKTLKFHEARPLKQII